MTGSSEQSWGLLLAELDRAGKLRRATASAARAMHRAVELGAVSGFDVLALGTDLSAAEPALRQLGAETVLLCRDPSFAEQLAERLAPTIAQQASSYILLVGAATSFGKDVLPRVAARLGAGYLADCVDLATDGTRLVLKRPMYADNAVVTCSALTSTSVVSIRESAFAPLEAMSRPSQTRSLAPASPTGASARVEFVHFDAVRSERAPLTEARRIVAGGRALKERFFELLEPLADELDAALGATRAACDAEFAPSDCQVGQTGKIVAPDLYLAIGISGAIQHVAGIKSARTIVAINNDSEAPIFEVADYGLVADLHEAVPALVAELKRRRSEQNR